MENILEFYSIFKRTRERAGAGLVTLLLNSHETPDFLLYTNGFLATVVFQKDSRKERGAKVKSMIGAETQLIIVAFLAFCCCVSL